MSAVALSGEMSLAPIVTSPPGGDHGSHHQQTFSALSPIESFENHANQAEMATVPRALALNEEDIISCSSMHSSRVTRIGSSGSITLAAPSAPAGSGGPTAQAAATMTPPRPTGRVVLEVLETSPSGAATSVHRGGAADLDVLRNDNNSRLLSPSHPPPSMGEERASLAFGAEAQSFLHGSNGETGEARGAVARGTTYPTRSDDNRGENDDNSSPESFALPAPLALSFSPGSCDVAADPAELSPMAPTKARNSMTGAGGRPTIIRSPSAGAEPTRRSFAGFGSFPNFFQRNGSKANVWGALGTREQSSKKWSMLYSGQSGKSAEYEDEALGLDDDASERARRNWRVLRAVFMALGKATTARAWKGLVVGGSVRVCGSKQVGFETNNTQGP